MPRTKAVKAKPREKSVNSIPEPPISDSKQKKLALSDFLKQVEEERRKLNQSLQVGLDNQDNAYETMMLRLGTYADISFLDFVNTETPDPSEDSVMIESFNVPAGATSTAYKLPPSPSSMSPPVLQRVTRHSRARQLRETSILTRSISEDNLNSTYGSILAETVKKPRRTRSVSSKRKQVNYSASKYTTPTSAVYLPKAVTPKVDPKTAIIKRFPKVGESALSMTGSPLMVSAANPEMALTLPVDNGEVYSIYPSESFDAAAIPEIGEHTRRQILQLRKNLDRLLKH